MSANLTNKTGRQIFAKIRGAFIYDMEGTGNQINIATRGLDPHRSWEYNVRQNGILINSDIYGYPASHYSMPLVSRVNNILDKQYFTKRPLFYPGPGVWSSDGRSIVISLGVNF